jgi:hypothetical protein
MTFIVQSATAPACFRPGEYYTREGAENALILSGYDKVDHPSGRVFIKSSLMGLGSRSVCRVVEIP